MIQRLKHRFRLCGGWMPEIIDGKPIIKTDCHLCLKDYEVMEVDWLSAIYE